MQTEKMMTVSRYCQDLFDLAINIKVTDRQGLPATLDEGGCFVIDLLGRVKESGKKAMVIGNGGSAAIAGHMQNDLSKAVGIRTLAFHDVSLMTAMANDHGYVNAYESFVEQWSDQDDLLIAISSSGESANILKAVAVARGKGCHIVTLSGFSEVNPLRRSGDLNFYVPVSDYGYVETLHSVLTHYLTDMAQKN
ncbi:MAG: SIS domain-containing protein [Proteobacteria bacterium]|nr:SIS domain-containing protein [Pseudomonadota bacterium]MBU4296644.1 SIS domain-containing protein [Pseudomonadota bacterium]MCG2748437.1 SIS domain-containing protein [Desulfobulbaceae bacterium]